MVLALCTTMSLEAQEKQVKVWPKHLPAEISLSNEKYQEATEGGVTRILNMSLPTLEKYPVSSSTEEQDKVMIVCPGGGYQILAIDLEGSEIATWLNEQGYTAYILRYRVPNNREGALQDAQRAIRWVRKQHPDKKVGIMGFSAGAHLSASASTRFDQVAYSAIDEIDSLSARPDFAALIYPAYIDQGENRSLSPELTVSDHTPPMFVFQTADDFYGNSALTITQALRDHKVNVELHYYPKGGHGYGLRKGNRAGEIWPVLMAEWMKEIQ